MHRNRITSAVCDVIEECWVERSTARLLSTKADDQSSPASTDVWSRRSQCIQIGKKKLEKELIHYKGRDEAEYDWHITVRTRYDAETAHCYVVLEGLANSGVMFTSLYDGQTEELLATGSLMHKKEGGYKIFGGRIEDGGYIHLVPHRPNATGEEIPGDDYKAAMDYINDRMTEKR
jgi:hypothetical protein